MGRGSHLSSSTIDALLNIRAYISLRHSRAAYRRHPQWTAAASARIPLTAPSYAPTGSKRLSLYPVFMFPWKLGLTGNQSLFAPRPAFDNRRDAMSNNGPIAIRHPGDNFTISYCYLLYRSHLHWCRFTVSDKERTLAKLRHRKLAAPPPFPHSGIKCGDHACATRAVLFMTFDMEPAHKPASYSYHIYVLILCCRMHSFHI
ncbi:hypothetical protein P171DRAFT_176177 [Karstenula rhodostoma CBS 690.94]|uniref:Uncharacterized protein n=1 Tax=Karstenula rhodostoma CBS 690.94 TaxID=1392251 RepID=A0A9P4U5P1_9PLEO|nr:hypothetical protein P171DRAFT_176177 [Karstenula rhodostoma CBS 690.94]